VTSPRVGVQVVGALRSRGHEVAVVDTARGYIPESDEPALLSAGVGTEPPLSTGFTRWSKPPPVRSGKSRGSSRRRCALPCTPRGRGRMAPSRRCWRGGGSLHRSGRLGSAMAMDKDISKRLFRAAAVPTADWVMAPAARTLVERDYGWPVVVKPSKQGSTVGLTVVKGPRNTSPPWPWPGSTMTRS